MERLKELKEYADKVKLARPECLREIDGIVELFVSEVEQGGSVEHEYSLAVSDLEYILINGEE